MKTALLLLPVLLSAPGGAGNKEPARVEYHGWFSNPAFSADGKTLAYARLAALGPQDRTAPTQIVLWDVAAGKEARVFDGPKDDSLLTTFALSPDGKRASLVLWNTSLRLFDVPAGKEVAPAEKVKFVSQLQYSPDGSTLAWLREGEVVLADAATAKPLHTLGKDEAGPVTTFAFAAGGKTIIAGHAPSKVTGTGKNPTVEYEVGFWAYDAATGKKLHQVGTTVKDTRLRLQGAPPHAVVVVADGKTAVLATTAGVSFCDAATGKQTRETATPWKQDANDPVRKLVLSPNGQRLATVSAQGVLTVWDAAAGKELRRIETGQSLDHVVFSPDGRTLALTHQTPGRVGAVLLIYGL
jgi:WD40 repeat protein